jgi:hypothetical protein
MYSLCYYLHLCLTLLVAGADAGRAKLDAEVRALRDEVRLSLPVPSLLAYGL